MRTTVDLDDELLAKARARTEPMSHAKLMEMAFRTLIRRERGRERFRLKWNQRAHSAGGTARLGPRSAAGHAGRGPGARVTVTLDDELVAEARRLTDIQSLTELSRWALKALVERQAALALAKRGGTQPGLKVPPRRRFTADLKMIPR